MTKRVNHVGALIARCVSEHRCAPGEEAKIAKMRPVLRSRAEMKKVVPDRYPANIDSIGIELVGASHPATKPKAPNIYEPVTVEQNASLVWLIAGLSSALKVDTTEVFRHPTVSQKTPTEASTARW